MRAVPYSATRPRTWTPVKLARVDVGFARPGRSREARDCDVRARTACGAIICLRRQVPSAILAAGSSHFHCPRRPPMRHRVSVRRPRRWGRPGPARWVDRTVPAFVTAPVFDVGEGLVTEDLRSLVGGDFNRDGYPDVAGIDYFGNSVQVLLGGGDGSFREARVFPAGAEPQ